MYKANYNNSDVEHSSIIQCPYCGSWHTGPCSKVKKIEFFLDGGIKNIEFFTEEELNELCSSNLNK